MFLRNASMLGLGVGGKGRSEVGGGWWQKLERRSQMTQMTEFRVVMMYTSTHSGPAFHSKALNGNVLTVAAISVLYH